MKKVMLILIIIFGCGYRVLLAYQSSAKSLASSEMVPLPVKSVDNLLNQTATLTKPDGSDTNTSSQSQPEPKKFNNKFAYILNSNSTTISKCSINQASGLLEECSKVGRGFNAPTGIAVSENHSWMYVTNRGENNVSICQIESQFGDLDNCHPVNNEEFNKPTGITLDELNNVAYITNVGNDTVSRCDINPLNMELANCVQYHNRYFDYPSDIKLGLTGADLFVVNAGNNSVAKCSFDQEKQELICSSVLDGLSQPIAIFFTKNYVYIPNLASKSVTVCSSRLKDNKFTDCTNFTGNFSDVTDIFADENQGKIYITDEQKVSVCEKIGNNSVLSCNSSGEGFNSPSGIYLLNDTTRNKDTM